MSKLFKVKLCHTTARQKPLTTAEWLFYDVTIVCRRKKASSTTNAWETAVIAATARSGWSRHARQTQKETDRERKRGGS